MSNKEQIWQALVNQAKTIEKQHLAELFHTQPDRGETFSLQLEDLHVDYSRNKINADVIERLLELAESSQLQQKISKLFNGADVNLTENRSALHTLLRQSGDNDVKIDGQSGLQIVGDEQEKMYQLCQQLRAGQLRGASGQTINKLVNIGIGGSDLGPRLVLDSLSYFHTINLEFDFVANIDPSEIQTVLQQSNPESTLFIVVSKSFTTLETLTNAKQARDWLIENGCTDLNKHFIGVSENAEAVAEFGISQDYYLKIWPWVGGRYSVWSCAGFIACAVLGQENFKQFLAGANVMDKHFNSTELEKNIPVILGLLGVWYSSILDYPSHAVVPYAHSLRLLPDYLSQLVMESNGKSVSNDNERCQYNTSPILWGNVGSNAQHAFFQLLHQGTVKTSLDLIAIVNSPYKDAAHELLFANCIAQGKALMQGKENQEQPYRHFPGDKPSTTLLLNELSPHSLGMLLALYEHKTFVEAAIWDINPFDQWGVELGKVMAKEIGSMLEQDANDTDMDTSTKGLLGFYQAQKR